MSLLFSCLYLVSNTRSTAFSFRVYLAAKDFNDVMLHNARDVTD